MRKPDALFLDVAMEIARQLVDEAVWSGERCTWLGDAIGETDRGFEVVHRSLDASFYDGTAGVGWFLGHIYRVTGVPELRRAALGAVRHALATTNFTEAVRDGFYVGPAGVAFCATQVSDLIGDEDIGAAGSALGDRIAATTTKHALGDAELLGGAAGTLMGLLTLATASGDVQVVRAARSIGDRLLELAVPAGAGWAWPSSPFERGETPELCGFAHGAAGVASALVELHAATGEPAYLHGAVMACRYERSWYSSGRGWPDLRSPDGDGSDASVWPTYPAYWCHGAVGIGLQRLRLYQLTRDRVALAEVGAALAASRAAARAALESAIGFAANFSVCHGLGGIADLKAQAAVVLGETAHLEAARELGRAGLRARDSRQRWACGVLGGGETPGLMLGLAGIGACYLRLHDPAAMPPPSLPVRWTQPFDAGASAGALS